MIDDVKKVIGDYLKWIFIFGYLNIFVILLNSWEVLEEVVVKDFILVIGFLISEMLDVE